MSPKPPKTPDLVLAERLLLVTMCIRNAVNQGLWEEMPAYFSEREHLIDQIQMAQLGEEALECLDRIQEESSLIFADLRRERASVLKDLRSFDASTKTRSTYKTSSDHRSAWDELT